MAAKDLSAVRAKAWKTRREKYGPRGHNGSYARPARPCADCDRMRVLIVRLHVEGVLSEGQAARATGLHRIDLRKLADEMAPAAAVYETTGRLTQGEQTGENANPGAPFADEHLPEGQS